MAICNTFLAKYFSIFRFSFVFRNFCVRRGEGRRHGGAARPARPLGPGRALAATNAKIEKRGGQASERPGVRTPGRPGVRASGRPSVRTSERPSIRTSERPKIVENVRNLSYLFLLPSFQTHRYMKKRFSPTGKDIQTARKTSNGRKIPRIAPICTKI